MDNLETKMKGTKVEGTIPDLFEGKMIVRIFYFTIIIELSIIKSVDTKIYLSIT